MRDRTRLLKRLVVIIAVTVISVMLRTSSEAETYWEDDFETPLNNGTPFTPWDTCADPACPPNGSNPGISQDFAFSGTYSLKGHYTGKDSGRWIDRWIPTNEDVWTRFYYRTQNFTYDDVGTKHFYISDAISNTYPNFVIMHKGTDREFLAFAQVPAQGTPGMCPVGPYDGCYYTANVAHVPTVDNVWYCVETHFKMNAPGVANGVVEVWVNSVQTTSYTNALLRGPNASNPSNNSSQTVFNFFRLYVQHGVGDMYYDRVAVGNTRIPCAGSFASGQTPNPPIKPQLQ